MLVGLEEFEIAARFRSGPSQNESEVINQIRFGKLFEGFFMVLNVHHGQENS